MILVDTSVWIDHLRVSDPHLSTLLTKRVVRAHPWVVGELACGNIANRLGVIGNLQRLPQLPVAREHEVLFLIEHHKLMGKGIGYVDAHLITAALAAGASLWTKDKRLMGAIVNLGVQYSPPVV
jgi:predicted nucleic acid-binding protein